MIELKTSDTEITIVINKDLEQSIVNEFSKVIEQELKRKDRRDLVIDLKGCRFIDSGNLGLISLANREMTSQGRRLRLINVGKGVGATLSVTSLDMILDIKKEDK